MRSFSIVSKNGQVTIPRDIRKDYNLKEGTLVQFIKKADRIIIQKVQIQKEA